MGWTVGYSTRAEMLAELRSPPSRYGDRNQLLKSCVRGNVLWSVVAVTRDGQPNPVHYIGLDLMQKYRNPDEWGYKDMSEGSHPYQWSCPLSYLELAPVIQSEEWRAEVRTWHAKQSRKFVVGEYVRLSNCKVPYLQIYQTKPLVSYFRSQPYRVPRQRVELGRLSEQDLIALRQEGQHV